MEAGDFLTSSEAAHVVSVIWEGEGFCPDGVMTGQHLRGYYNALLETVSKSLMAMQRSSRNFGLVKSVVEVQRTGWTVKVREYASRSMSP